jgi:hypothetical protein
MGDLYPRSWLLQNYMSPLMAHEASCQTGCVTGDLHPQSRLWAKQVMCRVIPIPEPAGYVAGVHRPWSRVCAYRFYVSILTTHEALRHTGNMTGVHRPRSWLYAYRFYVSLLTTHEALCHTRCATDFIVLDHSGTPTDFGRVCDRDTSD